eukprot:5075552-Pyramimonas_sp.AAC.1
MQRGFIPTRNLGMNIFELDAYARMAGLEPSASERLPLLLAFDYSHAFLSVSHEWSFLVLSACSLPPP